MNIWEPKSDKFMSQAIWVQRVDEYWSLLSSKIKADTLRNIMDMNAGMGSFAAALKNKDVWVMNVVPENGPNLLKIIFDRGLIGTVHDWYVENSYSKKLETI